MMSYDSIVPLPVKGKSYDKFFKKTSIANSHNAQKHLCFLSFHLLFTWITKLKKLDFSIIEFVLKVTSIHTNEAQSIISHGKAKRFSHNLSIIKKIYFIRINMKKFYSLKFIRTKFYSRKKLSSNNIIPPKVVNSILFCPEWPKHFIPIQKTEQNETIFISF
jgi:hypothetical protein